MTAASKRPNPSKVKKSADNVKVTIPKTASSGIKHQVILPRSSSAMSSPSSSSRMSEDALVSSPRPLQTMTSSVSNGAFSPHKVPSPISASSASARISKRNGVWYLGGNHVVKLLTSVDGDLDHAMLSKLAAVPTVIGELALSVESLVSDDITVGGFENDILAKIASNTLTAKRGVVGPASSSTPSATSTRNLSTPVPTQLQDNGAHPESTAAANGHEGTPSAGGDAVPNPLLANYQPVPNPLAMRITPPASPHTNAEQQPTVSPKTRTDMPMIQAR